MPAGHVALIEAVAAANPNTVVLLSCGSVVECPWADAVGAILYVGLPGQAGGDAIVRLLYGHTNPSGKLAESWPIRYADCPTADYYKNRKNAQYREGIYVGYRYYDRAQTAVRWPFGYGLSYTSFAYSDLRIQGDVVTAVVTNTGDVAGAEVAQLYVAPLSGGLHRVAKELKGFCKVQLQPGERKTVTFRLGDRSFALWDDGWKIPSGDYTVLVGPSSAQLPLSAVIPKQGCAVAAPNWQRGSWYDAPQGSPTQETWETMLGRKYTETPTRKGEYTMDNTVDEMRAHSLVMKIMYRAVESTVAKGFGGKKDYENPEFRMLMASSAGGPLRSMQISGGIKGGLFAGLLDMANGHFLRGVCKMISR
jgi:beta-glucosidase